MIFSFCPAVARSLHLSFLARPRRSYGEDTRRSGNPVLRHTVSGKWQYRRQRITLGGSPKVPYITDNYFAHEISARWTEGSEVLAKFPETFLSIHHKCILKVFRLTKYKTFSIMWLIVDSIFQKHLASPSPNMETTWNVSKTNKIKKKESKMWNIHEKGVIQKRCSFFNFILTWKFYNFESLWFNFR